MQEALKLGLLELKDLPVKLQSKFAIPVQQAGNTQSARSERTRFSISRLNDPKARNQMNAALENQRWEVVLKRIPQGKGFGFVQHPDFETDIFCLLSKIASTGHHQLQEGQKLNVQIVTSYDDKKARWGFSVDSGRPA